eukprot:Gregarina_sp_Poly_1__6910@NODE_374_length_9120_cov_202_678449_g308_i0_p5_GENE_NODE_374_length_9120_cov_202_678449_g308_i0NODE_374_length_9120_cov_202_678449_g308_i0_p5_ORF_typecomplete_len237_score15_10Stirrup/PF09061_6/0_25_NODE_374_length_9120_cov_202_678449_g308_i040444754
MNSSEDSTSFIGTPRTTDNGIRSRRQLSVTIPAPKAPARSRTPMSHPLAMSQNQAWRLLQWQRQNRARHNVVMARLAQRRAFNATKEDAAAAAVKHATDFTQPRSWGQVLFKEKPYHRATQAGLPVPVHFPLSPASPLWPIPRTPHLARYRRKSMIPHLPKRETRSHTVTHPNGMKHPHSVKHPQIVTCSTTATSAWTVENSKRHELVVGGNASKVLISLERLPENKGWRVGWEVN